ncbi:CynX/NimT family MFS transporter [Streptacidiphilus cavernicola]|uniref:CynX/NimT family MFS transporter n=1 Tax=Streptacidiphilus cavernicola TaxID=3342716 RepID=A0ABV6VVY6_9ACTN
MSRTTLDATAGRAADVANAPSLAARIAVHPVTALVGILLVSLNMRAALSAVSPLLTDVSGTYGLSSTAGGLLTTLPVLLMGVTAPFVPRLVRTLGPERVVLGALGLLAAGVGLRVLPGAPALFGGSMVIGSAIALLNVTLPGLVKRDFPDRAAAMTGVYSTAMIVGATLAAALSVPMEHAFGGWRGSMASWAVLALFAGAAWLPQVRRLPRRLGSGAAAGAGAGAGAEAAAGAGATAGAGAGAAGAGAAAGAGTGAAAGAVVGVWRHPMAWQLAVYMGMMSLLSYTLIAWMPTILTDQGMDRGTAGAVFAFCNLVQVGGAFLVPLLAGRMTSQRALVAVMVGCNVAGITGLILAPVGGAWLWAALLGVAQGGGFGLALAMIVLRSGGATVASQLSGMSQMVGYFIAACGPVGFGALHQLTDGWGLPLALLLGCCGIALVAGLGAGRARTLRAG